MRKEGARAQSELGEQSVVPQGPIQSVSSACGILSKLVEKVLHSMGHQHRCPLPSAAGPRKPHVRMPIRSGRGGDCILRREMDAFTGDVFLVHSLCARSRSASRGYSSK